MLEQLDNTVVWMDAKRAFRKFNLSLGVLTRLEKEGKIRSCSLAEGTMKRGKRLYDANSIQGYLHSMVKYLK